MQDFLTQFNPQEYVKEFKREVDSGIGRAFQQLGQRIPENVKRVFLGSKDQQGIRDGEGQNWKPTSRIALHFRTTYPQSGDKKTGKKGYTQAQARYLYSAKTLIDTGTLSRSPKMMELTVSDLKTEMWIGSPLPYASLHDLGGNTSFHGKTITVPSRPIFFFATMDKQEIDETMVREVSK